MTVDVLIAGAGASGLAAAITAARAGASVAVCDASAKIGRSIMASGNGRCNFANADLEPAHYNDPGFVERVMGDDPLGDILGFFGSLGLWHMCDEAGRYYPRSRAAASVLDVLTAELVRQGIQVLTEAPVDGARRRGDRWSASVAGTAGDVEAGSLVWAAGGGTGSCLADALGLRLVEQRAVLCPIATEPAPPRALDGVRCAARVRLVRGGTDVFDGRGELLWRPYGVSGIVVFDASRYARPGDELVVDVFDDVSHRLLRDELERRVSRGLACTAAPPARRRPSKNKEREWAPSLLDGMVHPRLASYLSQVVAPMLADGAAGAQAAASALKGMRMRVKGTADEEHAQVTRGGLANGQWAPDTLECRTEPGLFACGEALDVDGPCGGYNLAWAWKSGMLAGAAAARRSRGVAEGLT